MKQNPNQKQLNKKSGKLLLAAAGVTLAAAAGTALAVHIRRSRAKDAAVTQQQGKTETAAEKKKNRRSAGLLLLTALISLAAVAGVSYATYISRSYVKGVATSPKQTLDLSSNYLTITAKTATQDSYTTRKILLDEGDTDQDYVVTFYIQNTSSGAVSKKVMQYTLQISNLPDGATVTMGGTDLTSAVKTGYLSDTMTAYLKTTHTYSITIPHENIASMGSIVITAVPTADCDTSGNILAGKLQPGITGKVAGFSYTGEFLDATSANHPYDFVAFNYEISVTNANGSHTMLLTWDNTKVEIDPQFKTGTITTTGTQSVLTLTMDDDYSDDMIKFYRKAGQNRNETWQQSWDGMESVISFKEQ